MAADDHSTLTGNNLHESKGFAEAGNNALSVKNERGASAWEARNVLPAVLSITSSLAVPPTEVDGDAYIINAAGVSLDVNTIAWQSVNTIRYTFNSAPDLSIYATTDYLIVKSATLSINNGRFVITAIDNTAKWIEITNTNRSSATDNEAANSPATGVVTKSNWDGCGQWEFVRYNLVDNKWYYIVPIEGQQCFIKNLGVIYFFKTSAAGVGLFQEQINEANEISGSENNITATAGGGQTNAYQLTKKINNVTTVATAADSVKMPLALVSRECYIRNSAALSLAVFPSATEAFSQQAAGINLTTNQAVIAICIKAGTWSFVIIT